MDRKKKGKSKGAKLGAIEETIEVDKNKEKGEAVGENGGEEKYSSPLYQAYMAKLLTNRGCQDEVKSRRVSVKDMIDKAEMESRSGESSNIGSPVNFRASLKQLPEVKENESEKAKVEIGNETKTSNENKNGGVATGNDEKICESKTNEKNVDLAKSGETTKESAKVA